MTSSNSEKSQIRYAGLAGFMFLFVIVADLSGMFITSRFDVPGNFVETAHRIMGAELLYRIGLSSGLIGSLCTLFLAIGLYVVLKPIDNNLALLALLFRSIEAALGGVQNIFSFVVLKLYLGADYINAFNPKQLSVLVDAHSLASSATNVSAIFFGVGSILFFYLFLNSAYIPKALSALGLLASLLVPIICFASLISPQHARIGQFGWLPIAVAEISVGFWLLFKGVSVQPRETEMWM